eukprot:TRINITY_DN5463_c0_g1_i1.p1 TRINITY_DN5463_c0_g1~~TRINITY_DN5463_c0_g1_i1.p1  ORF type:complete len:940 (+),score=162.27 TRINITY_DN5463_c0_g1_i1:55-2874(+)
MASSPGGLFETPGGDFHGSDSSIEFEQVPTGSALRGRRDRGQRPRHEVRVVPPDPVPTNGNTSTEESCDPFPSTPGRGGLSRASLATSAESLQFLECETPTGRAPSRAPPASAATLATSAATSLVFQTMPDLATTPAPAARGQPGRAAHAYRNALRTHDDGRSEALTGAETQQSLQFHTEPGSECPKDSASSRGSMSGAASLQFIECIDSPGHTCAPQTGGAEPSVDTDRESLQFEREESGEVHPPPLPSVPAASDAGGSAAGGGVASGRTAGPAGRGAATAVPAGRGGGRGKRAPQPPQARQSFPPHPAAPPPPRPREGRQAEECVAPAADGLDQQAAHRYRRDRPVWQPTGSQAVRTHDAAYIGGSFGAPPQPQRGGVIERSGHFAKIREIDQKRRELQLSQRDSRNLSGDRSFLSTQGNGWNMTGCFPNLKPVDEVKRKRYGGQFDAVSSKLMDWYSLRSRTPPARRTHTPPGHRPVWRGAGNVRKPQPAPLRVDADRASPDATAAAGSVHAHGSPGDGTVASASTEAEVLRLREENQRLGRMVGEMRKRMEQVDQTEPPLTRPRLTVDEAVAAAAAFHQPLPHSPSPRGKRASAGAPLRQRGAASQVWPTYNRAHLMPQVESETEVQDTGEFRGASTSPMRRSPSPAGFAGVGMSPRHAFALGSPPRQLPHHEYSPCAAASDVDLPLPAAAPPAPAPLAPPRRPLPGLPPDGPRRSNSAPRRGEPYVRRGEPFVRRPPAAPAYTGRSSTSAVQSTSAAPRSRRPTPHRRPHRRVSAPPVTGGRRRDLSSPPRQTASSPVSSPRYVSAPDDRAEAWRGAGGVPSAAVAAQLRLRNLEQVPRNAVRQQPHTARERRRWVDADSLIDEPHRTLQPPPSHRGDHLNGDGPAGLHTVARGYVVPIKRRASLDAGLAIRISRGTVHPASTYDRSIYRPRWK